MVKKMDKLINFVEEKMGCVFSESLASAIFYSGIVLGIALILLEVVFALAFVLFMMTNFGLALLYLVIDFVVFFLTMFGMMYLKAWWEARI